MSMGRDREQVELRGGEPSQADEAETSESAQRIVVMISRLCCRAPVNQDVAQIEPERAALLRGHGLRIVQDDAQFLGDGQLHVERRRRCRTRPPQLRLLVVAVEELFRAHAVDSALA